MALVAFDTETYLIEAGLLAPPLVCLTLAWTGAPPEWVPAHDPAVGVLVERDDATGLTAALLTADAVTEDLVRALLREEAVGANTPYDLLVLAAHAPGALPDVFAALAAGRLSDVQVRERLILNSRGALAHARVSLADLVYRYLGEEPGRAVLATKGPDTWRTRYAELDGVPLEEWPDAATAYALDDARLTLRVYLAQADGPAEVGGYPFRVATPHGPRIVTEDRELRAAWAFHLMSAWGLRTDPDAVEPLLAQWTTTAEGLPAVQETPIATRPDVRRSVRVHYESDVSKVLDLIIRALDAGQCVAWIRNTVADALQARELVLPHVAAQQVTLFHARFTLGDRLDVESQVLNQLGPDSTPERRRGHGAQGQVQVAQGDVPAQGHVRRASLGAHGQVAVAGFMSMGVC